MNMSYDDILLYYTSNGTSAELLKSLETKLFTMKRTYEEMKLHIDKREQCSFEIVTLPEYICYSREYTGTTTDDKYWNMYNLFHEVVKKGYKPLPSEPLFIINKRTDFLEGEFTDIECNFLYCITSWSRIQRRRKQRFIPRARHFPVCIYGGYDKLPEAYNELGWKMRELRLKPIGYPRGLALVAPYTGREIPADNYVSQLAVPD